MSIFRPRNTPPASTQYLSTSTKQVDNHILGTSNDQEQNKSSPLSLYYKLKYTMSSKLHVLTQITTSIIIAIAIKMQLSTSIIGASLLSSIFILSFVFLHVYSQNDHTHHYHLRNSGWLDSAVSLVTSISPSAANKVDITISLITVAQLFIYNIMLTLFFTVFISCILWCWQYNC